MSIKCDCERANKSKWSFSRGFDNKTTIIVSYRYICIFGVDYAGLVGGSHILVANMSKLICVSLSNRGFAISII